MELELFTVSIKENGTVKVEFNPELLDIVTEKELINEMTGKMDELIDIADMVASFIQSKY